MRLLASLLLALALCACGAHARKPPALAQHPYGAASSLTAGGSLYANNGSWSNGSTTFTYQWEDCDANGANCVNAAGSPSTNRVYTLVSGDAGFTIRVAVTGNNGGTQTSPQSGVVQAAGTFPLSVSSNGRFLKNASAQPWLMVGDSPWTPIGSVDRAHWDSYLTDRAAHGFNTVLVSALCDSYITCVVTTGKALDGTAPFSTGTSIATYNLSSANAAYWTEVHNMVADAQADGIAVLLDPIETGNCDSSTSWWAAIAANGDGTLSTSDNDYLYGQFLGNEFKDLSNVIWLSGNDFGCYTTAASDANVLTVAKGIKSTNPSALQSLELSFYFSHSLEDTTHDWTSTISLDGVYSYFPQYNETSQAYGETHTTPTFFQEGDYEGQTFGKGGSVRDVRIQEWWSTTSGAMGQVYGGPCFAFTNSTVLSSCDSTGVTQLGYLTGLLQSRDWQNLAPDTGHTLVFCGSSGTACGSCPSDNVLALTDYDTVNCVTDVQTADDKTAFVYLPQGGTITVNLAGFAGSVTARWLDPTNDTFSSISGSPFANSGTNSFTAPTATGQTAGSGKNSSGNPDWVLVLES